MTNKSGTLYVGVTNDIERRVWEHRFSTDASFTRRYKMDRLLYYEDYGNVTEAIDREKQLKGWLRRKKIELIREANPAWEDLASDWFDKGPDSSLRSE
jgi:putative endonuclease